MLTTFQKLCIRPDLGFAYDKSSMVEIADGGSFTELLCKVTSKCDTSILLLTSHKGKIQDFAVKLVGLQSPQPASLSVTSAVLSGFKKGLSYLNGNGSTTSHPEPQLSETEQVCQAWEECKASGYHGMQVISLLDKEMMPDNDCRKLYNLHQFMTVTLQSIHAYYMFQKPNVAFVYDANFNTDQLIEAYPNADTFAIAFIWRFAENPATSTGRIRPTPIIRASIRSEPVVPFSKAGPSSLLDTSMSRKPRTTVSTTVTTTKKKITETCDDSGLLHKTIEESRPTVTSFTTSKDVEIDQEYEEQSDYEDTEDQEEIVIAPVLAKKSKNTTPAGLRQQQSATPSSGVKPCTHSPILNATPTKVISPIHLRATPVVSSGQSCKLSLATPSKTASQSTPASRDREIASVEPPTSIGFRRLGRSAPVPHVAATLQPDVVHELPTVRRVKGTPKRQSVTPRSRSKRKLPDDEVEQQHDVYDEEDIDHMETEISFKPPVKLPQPHETTMDVDDADTTTTFDPNSITLSFDDAASAPAKQRGGRKSMAARKSLANEWPADDQLHMLHFYDNLNTANNAEASRVALTCKYALIQYDRDLSSKLLYTWLERKGRLSQQELTNYTLQESDEKETTLALYHSLSNGLQSEATRISFTLKFIKAQYGVTVTSKELFQWLKEKSKKAKK